MLSDQDYFDQRRGGVVWFTLQHTTLWFRNTFTSLGINQFQANQMVHSFDWTKTDPLPEYEYPSRPTLFYMSVLISQPEQEWGLRQLGVQILDKPLFLLSNATNSTRLQKSGEQVVGEWKFAVVSGYAYNDVRERMQAQIANGESPAFEAIVYRRIPVTDARFQHE